MKTEHVHALILGAGPAGLAAAYQLSKAGVAPAVLDKSDGAGGLMRSIQRGAFSVDLGRKELYDRIPAVDRLWTEVLGDAYRPYSHRVGVLYHDRIFECGSEYRGFRRGVPWPLFFLGMLDYAWYATRFSLRSPQNYEAYRYRRRGRRFTRMFAQGFNEKFEGRRWAEMAQDAPAGGKHPTFREAVFGQRTPMAATDMPRWRHPAKGSGQIAQLLERHISKAGGRFYFGARVSGMRMLRGRITHVLVETQTDELMFRPQYVVSSLPIEVLCQLIWPNALDAVARDGPGSSPGSRSTILVYLFSSAPPKFPHCWLRVTCPTTRMGRVTNYAAFNGEMVPHGQSCLCIEFFCTFADPLLDLDPETLYVRTLGECGRAGLVDPATCFDHLVLKLPGVDAATRWQDWLTTSRRDLLTAIRVVRNLYDVNRPGTDKATYAGLLAAGAILTGDRTTFDRCTDIGRGGFPAG